MVVHTWQEGHELEARPSYVVRPYFKGEKVKINKKISGFLKFHLSFIMSFIDAKSLDLNFC